MASPTDSRDRSELADAQPDASMQGDDGESSPRGVRTRIRRKTQPGEVGMERPRTPPTRRPENRMHFHQERWPDDAWRLRLQRS